MTRSPYELTPAQTRMIFDVKGWSKIVAFHTRNVPHRGHEHIIAHACERCHADGVLIHPAIGPKKPGDFSADAILGAYERLIRLAYPNALLAAFGTYSRYCGPREAVFTALCRKNFGCTHFVLGRDHTGVGDFYAPHQNRELFESLGDIGITPVFFDTVYFSDEAGDTVESDEGTNTTRAAAMAAATAGASATASPPECSHEVDALGDGPRRRAPGTRGEAKDASPEPGRSRGGLSQVSRPGGQAEEREQGHAGRQQDRRGRRPRDHAARRDRRPPGRSQAADLGHHAGGDVHRERHVLAQPLQVVDQAPLEVVSHLGLTEMLGVPTHQDLAQRFPRPRMSRVLIVPSGTSRIRAASSTFRPSTCTRKIASRYRGSISARARRTSPARSFRLEGATPAPGVRVSSTCAGHLHPSCAPLAGASRPVPGRDWPPGGRARWRTGGGAGLLRAASGAA